MQLFSNSLAQTFREKGGELILNKRVKNILTNNKKAIGILIDGDVVYNSRYVVSNADAMETFNTLLDFKHNVIIDKLKNMEPTFSAFAVYLGVNSSLRRELNDRCTTWYFTTYDIDSCYEFPMENLISEAPNYVVCLFPSFHNNLSPDTNKTSMILFSAASYKTEKYWNQNKSKFAQKLIHKAENIIPNLSKYIEVSEIATPHTFYKYTSNHRGALYGWACTVDQISKETFPQDSDVENLALVGHWCTNGVGQGGISEVIYSGKKAATFILQKLTEKVKA